MRPTRIALTAIVGLIAALLAWRYAVRRWTLPCPAAIGWSLELGVRERLLPTPLVLERMGLHPGLRVLEVGPGTGYMSVPVARRLGETGHLVALELQPAMADRARQRLAAAGITNAEVREGDVTTAPLEANYDLTFLVTVLGEITDRDLAIARVRDALKPGGILSFTEVFGDPHYQRYADLERRCRAADLEPVGRHGSWLAYTANFRRPAMD
jgi:protein-L-isoaspartate O-methyltransferase